MCCRDETTKRRVLFGFVLIFAISLVTAGFLMLNESQKITEETKQKQKELERRQDRTNVILNLHQVMLNKSQKTTKQTTTRSK